VCMCVCMCVCVCVCVRLQMSLLIYRLCDEYVYTKVLIIDKINFVLAINNARRLYDLTTPPN
jgi:hypothetical protein